MTSEIQSKYQNKLDKLCTHLYKRDFRSCEEFLITQIDYLLKETMKSHLTPDESTEFIKTVYSNFNNYYLNWVERNGGNTMKEMHDLISDEHSNFLISHCRQVADMEDLLYEVSNYIVQPKNHENQEEAEYYLTCYKKYLNS